MGKKRPVRENFFDGFRPKMLDKPSEMACIFLVNTVGKGQTKGQTFTVASFNDSNSTKTIKKWLETKKKSQNPKISVLFLGSG